MDWQSFVPFIPFFASFFGVLTAFLLQWLGKLYDRRKDRKQFLQEAREELRFCSDRLASHIKKVDFELMQGSPHLMSLQTAAKHLLPTDIWESGKASGWLSLVHHQTKTKLAAIYFRIECNNNETERVRDARILAERESDRAVSSPIYQGRPYEEDQWLDLSSRLNEEEQQLKKDIDDLLKEDIWE